MGPTAPGCATSLAKEPAAGSAAAKRWSGGQADARAAVEPQGRAIARHTGMPRLDRSRLAVLDLDGALARARLGMAVRPGPDHVGNRHRHQAGGADSPAAACLQAALAVRLGAGAAAAVHHRGETAARQLDQAGPGSAPRQHVGIAATGRRRLQRASDIAASPLRNASPSGCAPRPWRSWLNLSPGTARMKLSAPRVCSQVKSTDSMLRRPWRSPRPRSGAFSRRRSEPRAAKAGA